MAFVWQYNPATTYQIWDQVSYLWWYYTAFQITTWNLPTDSNFWLVDSAIPDIPANQLPVKTDPLVNWDMVLLSKDSEDWDRVKQWAYELFIWPEGPEWMNWQWAYDNWTAYEIDDWVSYDWSSYICTQAWTWNLPTDIAFWDIFAQAWEWDMNKSVYDTNDNWVVDDSDVPANAISDKILLSEQNTEIADSINEQLDYWFISWLDSWDYWSADTWLWTFTVLRWWTWRINWKLITWAWDVAWSKTISLNLWETVFVYIDANWDIQSSTGFVAEVIMLFEVWRCATWVNIIPVKENHPYSFDSQVSSSWHRVFWVAFTKDSIWALVWERVTTWTWAVWTDREIKAVWNWTFEDHWLSTTVADSGWLWVSMRFPFVNVWWKWECAWSWTELLMEYNNAWVNTTLVDWKYWVYKFYATKDNINSSDPVLMALMASESYNNQTAAETAITEDLAWTPNNVNSPTNELKTLELARLGYAIVLQNASWWYIISVSTNLEVAWSWNSSSVWWAASSTSVDTTNFTKNLSWTDTNVQIALETLDQLSWWLSDWDSWTTYAQLDLVIDSWDIYKSKINSNLDNNPSVFTGTFPDLTINYTVKWILVTSWEDTSMNWWAYSADWTVLMMLWITWDKVFQYDLAIPFEPKSWVYSWNSISTWAVNVSWIYLMQDWLDFYLTETSWVNLQRWTMSSANDLSTASANWVWPTSPARNMACLAMMDDWSRFWALDTSDVIHEYDMTTPKDITTLLATWQTFSVATQDSQPQWISISSDWTKMLMAWSASDKIHQYNLPNPNSLVWINAPWISYSVIWDTWWTMSWFFATPDFLELLVIDTLKTYPYWYIDENWLKITS